ncbi:hypothetical protein FA13DRAFT_1726884, partial [Coprinellus micaceus]
MYYIECGATFIRRSHNSACGWVDWMETMGETKRHKRPYWYTRVRLECNGPSSR